MKNIYTLNVQLYIERKRLEAMVGKYGLLHPRVITQSQKLDKIIFQLQRLMVKQFPLKKASSVLSLAKTV